MNILLVIIVSVIVFSALVMVMGLQTRQVVRITGTLVAVVLVVSSFIYGSCYAAIYDSFSIAVLKTVNAIIQMFLGNDEIGSISAAPLMQHQIFQIFVYIAHILAMYITISAVLTAVAMRLLRRISLLFARRGSLDLIYGVSDDTISFAESVLDSRRDTLVFVGSSSSSVFESAIARQNGVLFFEPKYTDNASGLIKSIGIRSGSRKLRVYCLDPDVNKNLEFAEKLRQALKEAGIAAEQTYLSIILRDEMAGGKLQASAENGYGYGSVLAMNEKDLTARLLIKTCPPYSAVRFDGEGRARDNFEAMIIGFGSTGQAVLRQLVMNAQFAGSRFRAVIVSRDGDRVAGNFFATYPYLEKAYDTEVLEMNARSREFYAFLKKNVKRLRYIVICTGSEREDTEIFPELEHFIRSAGSDAVLARCGRKGVSVSTPSGIPAEVSLYKRDILCGDGLDAAAKIVNHCYSELYNGTAGDADAEWSACRYYDRVSSRAAADYAGAFLAAAGKDSVEVIEHGFGEDGSPLMENLSESEHLRWCGFMYAMGYSPMPSEVLKQRIASFKELKRKGTPDKDNIRVARDDEEMLHACLVPRADLKALEELELKETGLERHYVQSDTENVKVVKNILKALADRNRLGK